MRKYSDESLKVLVVFEQRKPPIPRKYKVTDKRGSVHTVVVDKVTFVDRGAVPFVVYHCESYFENRVVRYKLRYWKDSFEWELFYFR